MEYGDHNDHAFVSPGYSYRGRLGIIHDGNGGKEKDKSAVSDPISTEKATFALGNQESGEWQCA